MLSFFKQMTGKSKNSLQVVFGNTERVKGLWHLDIKLPPKVETGWDVELYHNDKLIYRKANCETQNKNFLAINTHLFPNQKCTFQIRLSSNGETYENTFSITPNNNTKLANELKSYIADNSMPVAFVNDVNSTYFPPEKQSLAPWFEQDNFDSKLDAIQEKYHLTSEELNNLRFFKKNGYIVLSNAVQNKLVQECKRDLENAAEIGYQGYKDGSSQRLEQLHDKYESIRKLWQHETVTRYLTILFDTPPRPCQTLGYVYGSQQELHQDTIHLTPFPRGYMCGVWVALEDVQVNSGELMVIPESHNFKRILMKDASCPTVKKPEDWNTFSDTVLPVLRDMTAKSGLKPIPYLAKAGDILIWHENLMHGGSTRKDPSITRKSIVSHYFADGAIAYYDSTATPGFILPE